MTPPTGEGGIRTPGTGICPYDGLANRCLKPLGHLSKVFIYNKLCNIKISPEIATTPLATPQNDVSFVGKKWIFKGNSMAFTTKTKLKTRSDKFPLTLHATGQYCKKIRGKRVLFWKI